MQMHSDAKGDKWLKGKGPHCDYKLWVAGTGIALDSTNRLIHLKAGKAEKSYSFDDIRDWAYNKVSGGQVIGGPVMQSALHNAAERAQNREATGFFISVRDIDNPRWKIQMVDEHEMLRWMEIFRQHVNVA